MDTTPDAATPEPESPDAPPDPPRTANSDEPDPAAPDAGAEDAPAADAADEVAALRDQLLRAVAETENVRKRAARERADMARYAISDFARDVVGIADDLARALDNLPEPVRALAEAEALVEGLELTRRNLDAALERQGLVRIDPAGEPFDHNVHEAMFEIDDADAEPGAVVQVIQVGYRIHERLLRPARVGVARRPPAAASDRDGDGDGDAPA